MNDKNYVVQSLELHTFFARIMKEHAIFYIASFTPKNTDFVRQAEYYKENFEWVLQRAAGFAPGIVSPAFVAAQEAVTDYTLGSEQKTSNLTGITINTGITRTQANLWGAEEPTITPDLIARVKELNEHVKMLLDAYIKFNAAVLNNVLSCNMFTTNYPLNLDHMMEEAQEYSENLMSVEAGKYPEKNPVDMQKFWDDIMKEHAMFIRGLLDPTEESLMMTADKFVEIFSKLQDAVGNHGIINNISNITEETKRQVKSFAEFKESGVRGINECKIRSVIPPLLADHVLREAHHYLRLLNEVRTQ